MNTDGEPLDHRELAQEAEKGVAHFDPDELRGWSRTHVIQDVVRALDAGYSLSTEQLCAMIEKYQVLPLDFDSYQEDRIPYSPNPIKKGSSILFPDGINDFDDEDVGELHTIIQDNIKKDPAKRRKAIGALVGRGQEGFDELIRMGLTNPDTFAAVKKQEYRSIGAIDRYFAYTSGLTSSLITEYLGDDPLAISEFKKRFYAEIFASAKPPEESQIQPMIEKIIEDMTS